MSLQITPYVWVLLTSAAITGALATYAWRRRDVPPAAYFAVLMAMAFTWSFGYALEVVVVDLPAKLFWANVQYFCFAGCAAMWLAVALHMAGRGSWLTSSRLALISIIPAITVALVWTNDLHGLIRRDVFLDTSGLFPVISKSYGYWYWVLLIYTYALLGATVVLLVRMLLAARGPFRIQPLALLVGLLLPVVCSLAYTFGLSPIRGVDLAPAAISISGIVVAIGIFGFKLFDLAPVARDAVVEGMRDGVITLDNQDRVVDFNAAAETMLEGLSASAIGRHYRESLAPWPDLVDICQDRSKGWAEASLDSGEGQREIEVRVSPLFDRRGFTIGRVILMQDVTERKRAHSELLQQQRALAVLDERDRLARELHDNLAQVLGYVSTQGQAAREVLSQGKPILAGEMLTRLITVAQNAQGDAREYIAGTGTGPLTSRGLLPALDEYIGQFSQSSGLRTELVASPGIEQGMFEPVVEVQLLRIVQEALTNVRKHAHARSARVVLSMEGNNGEIVIEDDGRGFLPEQLPAIGRQSFGLRVIRERAMEFGGDVQVTSAPGVGTRVVVRVPLGKMARLRQVRILLVDDEPLYREGLRNLLAARGIQVVGTAEDGFDALKKTGSLRPDIVLMDIQMPRCDGLQATALIKAELPDVKVVILTVSARGDDLFTALRSGASSYLLKTSSADEMLDLLSEVARGEAAMPRGLATKILADLVRQGDPKEPVDSAAIDRAWELSARQLEVLTMVAHGMTYKEVGSALSLAESTVKFHMGQILEHLHLKNRAEAVALARRAGVLRSQGNPRSPLKRGS